MQTDYTERRDKGMIVLTPQPTAPLHARLMREVFPELPEAAAVEIHAPVPRVVPTLTAPRKPHDDTYDRAYDNFKYFLRRKSF